MNAFEDNLALNHPTVRPTSDDANWARIIWRDALEWVLSKKVEYFCATTSTGFAVPCQVIENEVEDSDNAQTSDASYPPWQGGPAVARPQVDIDNVLLSDDLES